MVTAEPTIEDCRKYESTGIKVSKINLVADPMEVIPNPTITPESPLYEYTGDVSDVNTGGSIKTIGGFVEVYPDPGPIILNELTYPEIIIDDTIAVDPNPIGDCMVTIGLFVYPYPPFERIIEEIVPAADTIAVADAPEIVS
jgi:hypothetical protein